MVAGSTESTKKLQNNLTYFLTTHISVCIHTYTHIYYIYYIMYVLYVLYIYIYNKTYTYIYIVERSQQVFTYNEEAKSTKHTSCSQKLELQQSHLGDD